MTTTEARCPDCGRSGGCDNDQTHIVPDPACPRCGEAEDGSEFCQCPEPVKDSNTSGGRVTERAESEHVKCDRCAHVRSRHEGIDGHLECADCTCANFRIAPGRTLPDPFGDWFRRIGTQLSDEDYEEGTRLLFAAERRPLEAALADKISIQICGFGIEELLAIRAGLAERHAHELMTDAAMANARAEAAKQTAHDLRLDLTAAEAERDAALEAAEDIRQARDHYQALANRLRADGADAARLGTLRAGVRALADEWEREEQNPMVDAMAEQLRVLLGGDA